MNVASIQVGPDVISITEFGSKAHYLAQIARLRIRTPAAVAIASSASSSPDAIHAAIKQLQFDTGHALGDRDKPLILSVRSSPTHSIAGVIGAVLNIGLDRRILQYRIEAGDPPRALFDCYAQLLERIGDLYAIHEPLRDELDKTLYADGVNVRRRLSAAAFETLAARYESVFQENGVSLPEASVDYVTKLACDVARSFHSETCLRYRFERQMTDEGMGLVVQVMVYGNADPRSATIACFSRNPANGAKQLYGECLAQAQGNQWSEQDMPQSVEALRGSNSDLYDELYRACSAMERVGKSMMDCEFTVDAGRVFCLQARPGRALPLAGIQIACDLVREGILEPRDAAKRVSEEDIEAVLQPQLDVDSAASEDVVLQAVGVSQGVSIGRLAASVAEARRFLDEGEPFIFVLPDVNTDEEARLAAHSAGVVVTAGGTVSDGAAIARHARVPCLARAVDVDIVEGEMSGQYGRVAVGDWVTIDGYNGILFANRQPLIYPDPSLEIRQIREWKQQFGIL